MKTYMLNKTIKIFIILICIIPILTTCVYADFSIGDIFKGADGFIENGINDDGPTIKEDDLQEMSNLLYNTLLIIAIVIAVIVGLVIGIQFMTGSVAQKAKVKETLIPYIAGCIVIFGAFVIWKLVVNILSKA